MHMAKTVLVVDDSSSFRTVVSNALTKAGYQVVEACDGADGLQKTADQRFAMVICDLNMPGVDGCQFARQFKAVPTNRFTPVLMLTTESQEAKKQQGRQAGVNAWLTKPFQPSRLLMAVQTLCPG